MKMKIVLWALLFFAAAQLQALNFDVLGTAISSSSKSGNVIEDTVTHGTGIQADNFSFINDFVTGQQEIIVKIKNPDLGNNASQAGLMIRETRSPGSPYLAVHINGNKTLKINERWYQGGFTSTRKTLYIHKAANIWLRIAKTGQLNNISIKYSKNGSWQHIDNGVYMPLGAYYVGLMSASGGSAAGFFDYRKFSISPLALKMASTARKASVYPNPTSGRIMFNFAPTQVALFDALGRQVEIEKLSINSFDLQGLPAGIYYLKADTFTLKIQKID